MAIETVTIINHSGKIISNGKHLIGLFKEAKASYQEKKAAVKAERAIKRSNTYDVAAVPEYYDEADYITPSGRRVSYDDVNSHAPSRRSHRSRHPRGPRDVPRSQAGTALTESNLRTLTEVSSTAPSRPPAGYRSPYAETIPWDSAVSRPTLARYEPAPVEYMEPSTRQQSMVVHSISDPTLQKKKEKEIDMNLAYGNIPPDLASRVDLDPAYKAAQKEQQAHGLVGKIEGLLTEAHCLQHTATHMIEHLQKNPDAAAAVALTLAELSALLKKMSPAFLGAIKAGSPAVFSLLASPQFLIAAGLTVGVTVVMFGGWKIVKRIKEAKEAEQQAMAFKAETVHYPVGDLPMGREPYPISEHSDGYDEALVLEEELSTIETWRRGIAPFGEDESADMELISPEADRARRSQYGLDEDDARTIRSSRTTRTTKTAKSHKTSHTHKSHRSSRPHAAEDVEVPDRHSSRGHREADRESNAGSERSHRSHRSSASKRTERTERTNLKAIEDGSRDRENTLEAVIRPKKDNMLKSIFKKKKDKEERSSIRMESVMV